MTIKMSNNVLSVSRYSSMVVLVMVLFLQACTKDTAPAKPVVKNQDFGRIPYVVQDNYTFSLFYAGLVATGYSDTLADNAGPYTLFVPNNDAMKSSHFYGLSYNDTTNYFLRVSNPSTADYVRYLILPQKVVLSGLPIGDNQVFTTLAGTPMYISKYLSGTDTVITVNGDKVISNDMVTSNGLINVISNVPQPQIFNSLWQQIQSASTLVYFATAIQRAGLQTFFDTAHNITVLAPDNSAFSNGPYKGYPNNMNIGSVQSIQTVDTALLRKMIYCSVLKGIYFTGDFDRNTVSTNYTTYNGATITFVPDPVYHSPSFKSNAYLWSSYSNSYSQITAGWLMGKYTSYVGWPTPYLDVPSGNGICQEVTGILLP